MARRLYTPFDHRESFATTRAEVLNRRQAVGLKRPSEYLHSSGRLFMFELLVPPESTQLKELDGDKDVYDREARPKLMVQAIQELQAAGVEPDVWKVEGMDWRYDCVNLVAAANRDGRETVVCITLVAVRTSRKYAPGSRPPPACRGSLASPLDARRSGLR